MQFHKTFDKVPCNRLICWLETHGINERPSMDRKLAEKQASGMWWTVVFMRVVRDFSRI